MQLLKDKSIREFLVIHIIFAFLTALTLLMPVTAPMSARLLIVVIVYNGLIMLQGFRIGFKDWMRIWIFSFILSLLMVFPDWYLSETLGALQFPADVFDVGVYGSVQAAVRFIPDPIHEVFPGKHPAGPPNECG